MSYRFPGVSRAIKPVISGTSTGHRPHNGHIASRGFHPMAPLGGKESTQRCHWGETRLPLDTPERRARPTHKDQNRAVQPAISGTSSVPEECLCRLRRYSTQTTQARSAGPRSSDGRGWCYWSELGGAVGRWPVLHAARLGQRRKARGTWNSRRRRALRLRTVILGRGPPNHVSPTRRCG